METEKEKNTPQVYSYHTFIFPFIWEQPDKAKQKDIDSFAACFVNNPNWVSTDMKDTSRLCKEETFADDNDEVLYYNTYQYFHPFVRKVIYGFDKSIVRNFSFLPDKVHNNALYHIYKSYEVSKGKTALRHFLLHINGIRLKIFNTGVALFILECENHGKDGDGLPQDDLDSVKSINDYGRRISLPFIPNKEGNYSSICADKLAVEIPSIGKTFADDFLGFAKKLTDIKAQGSISGEITLTHMCDFIKAILAYGSGFFFSSKKDSAAVENAIYVYPALDDRMFVASFILDPAETDRMRAQKDGDYAFLTDTELSRSIYQLAFIDPGRMNYDDSATGNCTCRSHKMRKRLLEEHVYDRWTEYPEDGSYGTIYTVANQGLTALCNYNGDNKLSNPFLTEYVQMCCLCLVQKATLIHFQHAVSTVSGNVEKPGKNISHGTIARLMNLQERFVAYQSQLSFTEVTAQEQGIELYELLRKFMFIEQECESLSDRLEKLEAAAETNLDFKFNKIALIFTFVAFFLSICGDFLMCFLNEDGTWWLSNSNLFIWIFAVVLSCVAISFIVIMILYRRRKK